MEITTAPNTHPLTFLIGFLIKTMLPLDFKLTPFPLINVHSTVLVWEARVSVKPAGK